MAEPLGEVGFDRYDRYNRYNRHDRYNRDDRFDCYDRSDRYTGGRGPRAAAREGRGQLCPRAALDARQPLVHRRVAALSPAHGGHGGRQRRRGRGRSE